MCCYSISDPCLNLQCKSGRLVRCDWVCGDDVCPANRTDNVIDIRALGRGIWHTLVTQWPLPCSQHQRQQHQQHLNVAEEAPRAPPVVLHVYQCYNKSNTDRRALETLIIHKKRNTRGDEHASQRCNGQVRAYLVLDEFLSSVNDREEPVGIADRDISRLEPSITRDR